MQIDNFYNRLSSRLENFSPCKLHHIPGIRIQCSFTLPISSSFAISSNGVDVLGKFYELIISEFSQQIERKMMKYISEYGKKSFLDLSGSELSPYSKSNSILMNLLRKSQKSLVGSARIVSEYIMDSQEFVPSSLSNALKPGGSIYSSGEIVRLNENMNVFVDPFMSWKENYILLYDNIRYDFTDLEFDDRQFPSLDQRVSASLNIKFEIDNPEVMFIYEDGFMDNFHLYKAEQREQKIDYIIDEHIESESHSTTRIHSQSKLGPGYYDNL